MADTPTLPADPVLLRGYCGPCDCLHIIRAHQWTTTAYGAGGMANGIAPERVRLNPTLAPVRDHVARVMAEGVRCDCDNGERTDRGGPDEIGVRVKCPDCHGSSYLLPPAPIEHLLDRPGSRLTAAQSAVFVADAYQRWRRGLPVVACVYILRPNGTIRDVAGTSGSEPSAYIQPDGSIQLPELPENA